ncbi:MAG TPA: enoyl-CoA hydratase/isomerase family protein, partial [Symbiobacteriaceae bacterium]|nr:enoyl-CoA hydratase/isomerase family protein [Symbiobacteriaceae bacterium]
MIFTKEMRDGLAVVTINRPPVNAISPEFIYELQELSHSFAQDKDVRAVLFVSAIPGKFIAGADLAGVLQDESGEPLADRLRRLNREWRRAFYGLERIPQPTIAAISGHCLGGGLEFALCCDYRLMVDDEKSHIGLTEVNLGLFPGAGGTVRLPRTIGLAKAREMILRGQKITARQAHAIGLVSEIYAPGEFETKALEFAQVLANGPTLALREA